MSATIPVSSRATERRNASTAERAEARLLVVPIGRYPSTVFVPARWSTTEATVPSPLPSTSSGGCSAMASRRTSSSVLGSVTAKVLVIVKPRERISASARGRGLLARLDRQLTTSTARRSRRMRSSRSRLRRLGSVMPGSYTPADADGQARP